MTITIIIGELGRGKTLTMTYFLLRDKVLLNRKIYANYNLLFADRIIYYPKELFELQEGSLGLDEGWIWINARATHSTQNKIINHLLLSSRKINLDVYITAQSFKQIDVWIRRICDIVVLPTFVNSQKCYIDYYTPDMIFIKREKFKPEPIFKLYNTRQIIPQPSIIKVIELIEKDKEILKTIEEYGDEIAIEQISEKYAINKNQAKSVLKYLRKKGII